MRKNRVRFQPGMSLMVFLERYGSESQCREALTQVHWPDEFRCQDCGHTDFGRLRALSADPAEWNDWISFFLTALIEQARENADKARAVMDL